MDRLSLIRDRALAMPAPKPKMCTYCQLEYRHTYGVTYRGRWYCDMRCAKTRHGRDTFLLLRAIVGPRPS